MTASLETFVQPVVTETDLGRALNRNLNLALLGIEAVARIRLVLDGAKTLVLKRREQATDLLKAHAAKVGPFKAASREWYLKEPGYKDHLEVRETFKALRDAGAPNAKILDAMAFQPAAVRTLCEVFDVDYSELVDRNFHRSALGMRKI